MSLEARVAVLEDKQENLDHAFHELTKIVEATHGVVSLMLNEQRDTKKIVDSLVLRADQHDKRFDKIEELLIQIVNNLASK